MNYILYQTTNMTNGKIYIGVHQTENLDDGYLGSGKLLKRSITKYGKDGFERTILETFDNGNDMYDREMIIVNDEFVKRDDTYNITTGGFGGYREQAGVVNRERLTGGKWEDLYDGDMLQHMRSMASDQAKKLCEQNKGRSPWNYGMRGEYIIDKPRSTASRNRTSISLKKSKKHKEWVKRSNSGENLIKKRQYHKDQTTEFWKDDDYRNKVLNGRKNSELGKKVEAQREWVLELLESNKYKNTEIAKIVGISPTRVGQFKKGR